MNIVIAKSLLEPGTIPWSSIVSGIPLTIDIEIAVSDYLDGVSKNVHAGVLDITPHSISEGILQVVRNHGIREVYGGYERLPWSGKKHLYQFYISYRASEKGKMEKFSSKIML